MGKEEGSCFRIYVYHLLSEVPKIPPSLQRTNNQRHNRQEYLNKDRNNKNALRISVSTPFKNPNRPVPSKTHY